MKRDTVCIRAPALAQRKKQRAIACIIRNRRRFTLWKGARQIRCHTPRRRYLRLALQLIARAPVTLRAGLVIATAIFSETQSLLQMHKSAPAQSHDLHAHSPDLSAIRNRLRDLCSYLWSAAYAIGVSVLRAAQSV